MWPGLTGWAVEGNGAYWLSEFQHEGCGFTVLGIRLLTCRADPMRSSAPVNCWLPLEQYRKLISVLPSAGVPERGWTSGNWKEDGRAVHHARGSPMRAGSSLWQSTPPGPGLPADRGAGDLHPGPRDRGAGRGASVSSWGLGLPLWLPRDADHARARRWRFHTLPVMNCSRESSFLPKLDTPRG